MVKLQKEEEQVLESAKEYIEALKGKKVRWSDTPPLLDPRSLDDQEILPNGKNAKVGDTYLERATNIQVRRPVKFKAKKVIGLPNTGEKVTRVDVEIPDEVVGIIKEGYKVWTVIQPKWTKEDQARVDKIHEKYTEIYKHREEYKKLYEQPPIKRWPRDRFPNGQYYTERWIPRIYNEQTKEWQQASEKDCQGWDDIPDDKKRVDFLKGVLPTED